MLSLLQNYAGNIEVDGEPEQGKPFHIILKSNTPEAVKEEQKDNTEYRITVKRYMTRKSNPGFDFMLKYNNDVPMPFVTMIGRKIKETKGMVYMELHGDIYAKTIPHCMKCGKPITNPVSQFFGMGPECGQHNYVNPFESDEELQKAVEQYRIQLQQVTWSGWVIKSAITEEVEL